MSWPTEHGGTDASGTQRGIWAEETARAGVPAQLNLVGLELAGPMIMRFGTPEQQQRFLPAILNGTEVWCQLFSEPDSGSDMASLRTRAIADGDRWRVSGRKIWTSGGHYADLGLLLARTEEGSRGREGITCFLLPMTRAGVATRPLPQMNGIVKFCEVSFDDVEVGHDDILGVLGDGWRVGTSTLGRERQMIGANAIRFASLLDELHDACRLAEDDVGTEARRRWTDLWFRVRLLRESWFAILASSPGPDDPRTSLLKLTATELERDITVLAQDLLGAEFVASPGASPWRDRFLAAPGQTIAGGTSEIQRNLIARRVLGLPSERSS
jgi:alkylation response protein AidB-like acyl-CoA dehydrogenase